MAADSCLSPELLLAWVHGKLTDAERVPALAHIEACGACREALSALARIVTIAPAHETVHDGPRARPASPLDALGIGAKLSGRFRILRVLGTGGMGVVVAARDEDLRRDVAIKLVRPDLAGVHDPRFMREAQALAALRHPNLVHVLDIGETEGAPYLVMELVDGSNLRHWLDATKPSWQGALAHCIAAGRGLAALHAAGYLHRDIKPDNVLVARDGRVLLADLGLAKRIAADATNLTNAGAIVGTPRYLAPERVAGDAGDERSDIYSFGVMTLEVMRSRGEQLPARLQAILSRAVDPDPAARFASMPALLTALDRPMHGRRIGPALVAGAVLALAGGGVWIAMSRTPATNSARAVVVVDGAVVILDAAAVDGAVVDAAVVDAARVDARARGATTNLDAPNLDAPTTPSDAAVLTATSFARELSIEYLREIGRGPATAAAAEAEALARDRGVCKRGAANLPLGWDWGKVERRELVDVKRTDGKVEKQLLYQVKGQARRYLFDGAYSTTSYLDVPVGELVLVCSSGARNDVLAPPGWQGDLVWSMYFGGPIKGPSPVLAKQPVYLSSNPRLEGDDWPHGDRVVLFVVASAPKEVSKGRRDMGDYFLEASAEATKLLATATDKQPVWVLAKFAKVFERYNKKYPVLRVIEVRRNLFE